MKFFPARSRTTPKEGPDGGAWRKREVHRTKDEGTQPRFQKKGHRLSGRRGKGNGGNGGADPRGGAAAGWDRHG